MITPGPGVLLAPFPIRLCHYCFFLAEAESPIGPWQLVSRKECERGDCRQLANFDKTGEIQK
jgi:hypothetical protein